MGYTRQAVALGFLLAGFATIEKHSIFRFVIYVAAAATFHKTAVAVLPLVALASVRQRPSTLILLAAVGGILGYFLVQRAMASLSASYIEQDYDAQGALIRIIMNIVPAVLFLAFRKRFAVTDFEGRLWRNFALAALGTLLLLFVTDSTVIVDRLALYLIPVQLFVFSRMPAAFPDRGRPNLQVAIAIILYSAAVQGTWLYFADHAQYWLPYQIYPFGAEVVPS
jgi:uncharacterized membrane protein YeaQ/YmgE (transglycosylase-associated protein family)